MESTQEGTEDLAVQVTSTEDLAVQVASLKVVSDRTKEAYDRARGELAKRMRRGDRVMAWSPLDENVKLGAITRTNPDKVTDVVDPEAFLAWVKEFYEDKVTPDFEITGTSEQVIATLYEHRRELLKLVSRVDVEFLRGIRIESSERGQPVGPGGELDIPGLKVTTPPSDLRCLPGRKAEVEVAELFRTGAVSLDALLGGA